MPSCALYLPINPFSSLQYRYITILQKCCGIFILLLLYTCHLLYLTSSIAPCVCVLMCLRFLVSSDVPHLTVPLIGASPLPTLHFHLLPCQPWRFDHDLWNGSARQHRCLQSPPRAPPSLRQPQRFPASRRSDPSVFLLGNIPVSYAVTLRVAQHRRQAHFWARSVFDRDVVT